MSDIFEKIFQNVTVPSAMNPGMRMISYEKATRYTPFFESVVDKIVRKHISLPYRVESTISRSAQYFECRVIINLAKASDPSAPYGVISILMVSPNNIYLNFIGRPDNVNAKKVYSFDDPDYFNNLCKTMIAYCERIK